MPASYAIPGRFDVQLTRPLIAVFDDIQNPFVHRIRFRKPPRFGGSMIADIAIPWICCNDPGPIAWNWQTDADAKAHVKEKTASLWQSCKPFRAILPRNRHDRTTTEIYFGPFFLVVQGANLSNLQSKGIRWMFNDELWLPVWQDLYEYAESRTRDYEQAGNYKIVDVSQAGNARDVEDRNWQQGQQAVWAYLGSDGKHRPLLFGGKRDDGSRWGLIWNEDAKRQDGTWNKQRAIETARYVCRDTKQEWPDSGETRAAWNRDGCYVAQNPNASHATRSYMVNALLKRDFASLVEQKIDAMELAKMGDMSAMRTFKQQAECVPWEEVNLTVTISTLAAGYTVNSFASGERWEGETHRSMMIDRQQGSGADLPHRWVEIRAWKANGDSRQLWFGRLETKEACRDLQKKYLVPDRCVWQDIAFERHEVFKECVEYGWMGVRGADATSWVHLMRNPADAKNPLRVHLPYSPIQQAQVGGEKQLAHYLLTHGDYFMDILANLLAGRGVRWELPDDVGEEYKKQIKGEHKVEKRPGQFRWEKIDSRVGNHALDTGRYGLTFAAVMRLLALPNTKQLEQLEQPPQVQQ